MADHAGVQHVVVQWHAYTDGSYVSSQGDVKAAWGFVVLAEICGGRYLRLGHAGGQIQDMHSSPQYVGVEMVGNYTAEVSAIVWALAWVMQMPCGTPFTVHYDCVSAAMVTVGAWRNTAEVKLVTVATTCFRLANSKRKLDINT